MKGRFKIDTRKFQHAARELAALAKKKPVLNVMRSAAGQVVRKVVSFTPPNSGTTAKESQRRGENAIASDLLKIAIPVGGVGRQPGFVSPAVMEGIRQQSRSQTSGRVRKGSLKQPYLLAEADFKAMLAAIYKRVGLLASGWNAAAQELKVALPAWIKRHGTARGRISISVSATRIRIFMANDVKFVDQLAFLQGKLQSALDSVAKSILEKQIPAAVENIAKKAGFKKK